MNIQKEKEKLYSLFLFDVSQDIKRPILSWNKLSINDAAQNS